MCYDRYSWDQNRRDLITVRVPWGAEGKMEESEVEVDFQPDSMKLTLGEEKFGLQVLHNSKPHINN